MSDIQRLRRMAQVARPNSTLRLVLSEVVALLPKVTSWQIVPTSGSAVCRYDRATGRPVSYEVRYQQGDIGNLVHELIHVAVNEAYGNDFVNYPNRLAQPPPRTYDAAGHCTNEFQRQTALMSQAGNGAVASSLATLTAWVHAARELSDVQRSAIAAKFNYGQQWPMKEYDTVITQALVWLHEWGFPATVPPGRPKPVVNALYEELDKAVFAAHRARLRG